MTHQPAGRVVVEELPPKALKKLGDAFAAVLAGSSSAQGLASADAAVTAFASPRRLAVRVGGVAAKAADRQVPQKLMPVSVALDAQGQPTPALLKKLLGLDLGADDVPSLRRRCRRQGRGAVRRQLVVAGATLDEGLQTALDEAIARLPIPKVMSYQLDDGWTSVKFVRPAHGLVALHGDRGGALPCARPERRPHDARSSLRSAPTIRSTLRDADGYAQQLEREGAVIASFEARRAEIERQLHAAAAARRLGADRRRGAARRSDRAGRTAERARVPVRRASSSPCRRSA